MKSNMRDLQRISGVAGESPLAGQRSKWELLGLRSEREIERQEL